MKKIAIILGALLLLLVVAGTFLTSRLDTYLNDNRDWIAEQVEAAIGRKVSFGALSVSFSGGLGVRIAELTVGEDPSFGTDDFAQLEEAVVRMKIWPALFGRYEVSGVLLRKPRLTLIQQPNAMNIDSLGQSEPVQPGTAGTTPSDAATDPAAAFAIALIDIEDGEIRYVDRTGPEPVSVQIERLNVDASDVSLERPITFELSASVLGAPRENLEMTGRVGPLDGNGPTGLDVRLTLSPVSVEALLALPQLAGSLPEGARAAGEIDVEARVHGDLAALTFEATLDASATDLELPDSVIKPAGTALSYQVEGKYADDVVEITTGTLTFDRVVLQTPGRIELADLAQYAFQLSARDVPLDGWEDMLPAVQGTGLAGRAGLDFAIRGSTAPEAAPALSGTIQLEDVAVRIPEQPAIESLRATLAVRDGGAELQEATFSVGGSPAKLTGRVPDLEAPKVQFTFTSEALRGESIGVNEPGDEEPDLYRALRVSGTAIPDESGTQVDASVTSGGGRISGVAYESLTGRLRADAREVVVDELIVQAFGGSAKARARYDLAASDKPPWSLDLGLIDIRAAQLAASQFGFASDMFDGKINSNLTLSGRGFDLASLAEALTGNGNIDVVEGMLKNVNIGELVLQKATGISGLSNLLSPEIRTQHQKLFTEGTTQFKALRSKLDVRDGRVHLSALDLIAPDFGISGTGSIGLQGDVRMAGTFKTTPELARSIAGSKKMLRYLADKDGRIAIPLELGGGLGGITVKPDLGSLRTGLVQAAQSELQDKAADFLTNALGAKKPKAKSEPKPTDDSAPDTSADLP